jgi:predicted TIM-barrel fold metal-dependent hydrolase
LPESLIFGRISAVTREADDISLPLPAGGDRYVVIDEWRRKIMPKHTDAAAKIAEMDKNGIGKAVVSINDPGPELFGKEWSSMAVMLNDFIARTVKEHPRRFVGLATLPFDSRDSMLREFERVTGKLGMKGILLYSNLAGRFPDEEQFQPLFAEAERKRVPVLLQSCGARYVGLQRRNTISRRCWG